MDPEVQRALNDLAERVDTVRHWAFGNGKEGAAETMRRLSSDIADVREDVADVSRAVAELAEAEKYRAEAEFARANQWKGAKRLVVIAVSAFGAGGAGIAVWLNATMQAILNNLP